MSTLLEHKTYTYKSKLYAVLGIVKMKCPINRDWKVAVKYKAATRDGLGYKLLADSPEYIREYGDFISKFEGK